MDDVDDIDVDVVVDDDDDGDDVKKKLFLDRGTSMPTSEQLRRSGGLHNRIESV